jgi:hypothetical protein
MPATAEAIPVRTVAARASTVKVHAKAQPVAWRNYIFIPLGTLAIVLPSFAAIWYFDDTPAEHQPQCVIPPPQVVNLPQPLQPRKLEPPPRRLPALGERLANASRFRQGDAFADKLFSPAEKTFPGPGSYAVIFSTPPDGKMMELWHREGLRSNEIYGPCSYEMIVLSEKTYELLRCPEVDAVAPLALQSAPKTQPRGLNSWR